jgi:hypothetical protein
MVSTPAPTSPSMAAEGRRPVQLFQVEVDRGRWRPGAGGQDGPVAEADDGHLPGNVDAPLLEHVGDAAGDLVGPRADRIPNHTSPPANPGPADARR